MDFLWERRVDGIYILAIDAPEGEYWMKATQIESSPNISEAKVYMDNVQKEAMQTFSIKDSAGKLIAEIEADSKTIAAIVFLLEEATKTQREKLAAWMIEHGFTTGHGDTQEDLLFELAWQVAELRLRTASSREEITEILRTIPREALVRAGIV